MKIVKSPCWHMKTCQYLLTSVDFNPSRSLLTYHVHNHVKCKMAIYPYLCLYLPCLLFTHDFHKQVNTWWLFALVTAAPCHVHCSLPSSVMFTVHSPRSWRGGRPACLQAAEPSCLRCPWQPEGCCLGSSSEPGALWPRCPERRRCWGTWRQSDRKVPGRGNQTSAKSTRMKQGLC